MTRFLRILGLMAAGALVAQCSFGVGTEGEAAFTPVATVDQVMDAIVIPSSEAIFDSVVYVNGELRTAPKTDDDWFRLRMHALAVAEAGNLLLMPPRLKDAGDWVTFSRQLTQAAVRVEQAADARNVDLMLETGSEMYEACTACHEKYLMAEPD